MRRLKKDPFWEGTYYEQFEAVNNCLRHLYSCLEMMLTAARAVEQEFKELEEKISREQG